MEGLFPMLNLIQLQMGDQKLGYTAFLGAFNFSNPLFKMTADAVAGKHKKMEPHEILEQSKNSFVVVKGSDRKSISYTFKDHDEDRTIVDFAEEGIECDYRHPNTNYDSDFENEEDRGDYQNVKFQPINTKVAHNLTTLAFANSESNCELKSSYPMQIAVRTDDSRKAIMYDCFEYKPSQCQDLPTNKSVDNFHKAFRLFGFGSGYDSDDYDSEEDEDYLNQQVKPKEGETFDEETKKMFGLQAIAGDFAFSRIFRHRFNIEDIVGIRLQKVDCDGADDVCPAVLILELGPKENASKVPSFCCRKIEALLTKSDNEANSLSSDVDCAYSSAPVYEDADSKPSSNKKQRNSCDKKKYALTVEDVNKLMEEKDLGDSNDCLKRAILCGYIDVKTMDKDTVIYRGSCLNCKSEVACTLGDASHQGNYGGCDYEDGGEGGAVQCEECENEDCSFGMYITGLCTNNASYDSGKFHNHCVECPDFGICIHDYREAHCSNCDSHYFAGNSGFPCPGCGARYGEEIRSKPLSTMPKPLPSCWNGKLEDEDSDAVLLQGIVNNLPQLSALAQEQKECIVS
ncbi:hypothetical protein CTEN210_17567 [Chaetoceros tenuissimus]|uniref:Uncharacterized protein n=1 Tax=Chaetoceros tenuissimus TaxID=426638 RepID=A0AAD3DAY7_9STRA|nr:hypothetical protein CTEN210_17567 [Chaetoceros tenuissimus]